MAKVSESSSKVDSPGNTNSANGEKESGRYILLEYKKI